MKIPTLRALALAHALCLPCAAALADEFHLKDGRVLVGNLVEKTDATIVIETREGRVSVPASEVKEHIEEADLLADFRKLARGADQSAFAQLRLAIEARSHGLDREMWKHLDAALAATEQVAVSASLQSQLDDFLGQLEPDLLPRKWRNAETAIRVRELLRQLRNDRERDLGRHAALVELLRREPNADPCLREQARSNRDADQRLLALEALARRGTPGNDKFVWRSAILDPRTEVREKSMKVSRRAGITDGAVDYLAPGLMHGNPEVRVRTAEAFANLGSPVAVKHLVVAGPSAGASLAVADQAVRAHVAFINQQAYIRDFDVEVAQASFIADPQIGVLQSGSVLDVTVAGAHTVRIVRAYRKALKGLTGNDPGADPRKWPTWLARNPVATEPAPTTPSGAAPGDGNDAGR